MATKKSGSAAKKTTKKLSADKPTTNVTTVKAVETNSSSSVLSSVRKNRTVLLTTFVAEFIGTFLLTAAYIITKGEPLYLGFTLVVIVLLVGTISGAHVNPIHTVGAWVTRKISHMSAIVYLVAQILGAVAALGLLTAFISGAPQQSAADAQAAMMNGSAAAPALFKVAALSSGKEWYVFFSELVGAVIFSFAVATALREKRDRVASAFTAGFGLFAAALTAGVAASYVSAYAVINPAIALSVNAVDWSKISWMAVAAYLVAPLIGGVLGFVVSDALRMARAKDEV